MKKLIFLFLLYTNLSVSKSILFIGDSFTAGYPHYSYSYIIKDSLKNVDVIAKSGATTAWMLANIPKKNYDIVYIWGGINDIFQKIPDSLAINNIQKMIDKLHGSEVHVIYGYDAIKFMRASTDDQKKLRDKYIEFQKKLYTLRGCKIVKPFLLNPPSHVDWTHPDGNQHKYIANLLLKELKNG